MGRGTERSEFVKGGPEPVEGPRHNAQHGRQAEITEAIRRQANDFRTDGDGAALAVRHPILGKKNRALILSKNTLLYLHESLPSLKHSNCH